MKKRDSGIELLRIIAMIMIIGIHLFYYGDFYSTVTDLAKFLGLSTSNPFSLEI